MTDFSIGEVGTSGLRLIGRKPLAIIVWGLFIFVALVLPTGLMFAMIGPDFADLFRQMGSGVPIDKDAVRDLVFEMQGRMALLNPLMTVLSLAGRAVLICAVFRAVLEPQKSAFAYLRLGAQELWVGLVLIVESILLALSIICAIIPVAIVVTILGVSHQAGAAVAAGFIGAAIIAGVAIWLVVRFSMALPLSFVERRFALFESWNFTKGHAGNLFLTALLVIVLVILMEMIVGAVVGAALLATGMSFNFDETAIRSFFEQPPQVWLRTLAPFVLGIGLMGAVVASAFNTVAVAPWAAAYKALSKGFAREPGVAGLALDG